MGRRGPPPKPTHLKVIAGNPGKRPLNVREPRSPKGRPRCPEWLGIEARKVWKRLVATLDGMGLLTAADADAIAAYAQTYVRWRKAEEFLERHGEVYPLRDEKGQIRCMQQFPQVAIARGLLQVLRAYQQEFGLTPAARSRITLPAEGPVFGDAARWLG